MKSILAIVATLMYVVLTVDGWTRTDILQVHSLQLYQAITAPAPPQLLLPSPRSVRPQLITWLQLATPRSRALCAARRQAPSLCMAHHTRPPTFIVHLSLPCTYYQLIISATSTYVTTEYKTVETKVPIVKTITKPVVVTTYNYETVTDYSTIKTASPCPTTWVLSPIDNPFRQENS